MGNCFSWTSARDEGTESENGAVGGSLGPDPLDPVPETAADAAGPSHAEPSVSGQLTAQDLQQQPPFDVLNRIEADQLEGLLQNYELDRIQEWVTGGGGAQPAAATSEITPVDDGPAGPAPAGGQPSTSQQPSPGTLAPQPRLPRNHPTRRADERDRTQSRVTEEVRAAQRSASTRPSRQRGTNPAHQRETPLNSPASDGRQPAELRRVQSERAAVGRQAQRQFSDRRRGQEIFRRIRLRNASLNGNRQRSEQRIDRANYRYVVQLRNMLSDRTERSSASSDDADLDPTI